MEEIPSQIQQAALDPHLSINDLNEICEAAKHYKFAAVCTNLSRVKTARKKLGSNAESKLVTVIGFPFGFIPTEHKKHEATWAISNGVEEIDMVPDFFSLAEGNIDYFAEEIATICEIGLPVRVILDLPRITLSKLSLAIDASIDAGAIGIMSGNGFGPSVKPTEISKLADLTKNRCSIKAVGGIKSKLQVIELIRSGASLIGTSFGNQIMNEIIQELH